MAFDQAHADTLRELDTLKKRIAEQVELMHGIIENGPWVLIPDSALREFVSRYVADSVAVLAAEIGADDAQHAAETVRAGGQLPIALEGS